MPCDSGEGRGGKERHGGGGVTGGVSSPVAVTGALWNGA